MSLYTIGLLYTLQTEHILAMFVAHFEIFLWVFLVKQLFHSRLLDILRQL